MKRFYLHNGSDQHGPYDLEDLKTKNISRETPIWFEGISHWTEAGDVAELIPLFTKTPPPFFISNATKKSNLSDNSNYKQVKKKSLLGTNSIIALVILGTLVGVNYWSKNKSTSEDLISSIKETYQEKVMTIAEIEQSQPTKFLTAYGNYNQNFWGNKLKVHGKITNNATVAIYKDALIKITYYSKTETVLGSTEYTIYEVFPPNTTKSFELKIDNYKETHSIDWEVIKASTY
jgi:hypothetical protein